MAPEITVFLPRERSALNVSLGLPLGPGPLVLREDIKISVEDVPRAERPAPR